MKTTQCVGEELREELARALSEMTQRTNENACVLLEDARTQKFIQFGRGPDLNLDLPTAGLSDNEATRAKKAFARLGVMQPRSVDAPDVDGEPTVRRFSVYECSFGGDAELAADAAIQVFTDVYQLPSAEYIVYEV